MNPRASRLTRNLAVAITGAGLALGAVACNNDVTSASSGTAAGSATATAATTASAGTSGAGTSGAGTSGAGTAAVKPSAAPAGSAKASIRCHTADLRADIQLQPGGTGSAMVMLVNKSTGPARSTATSATAGCWPTTAGSPCRPPARRTPGRRR